MPTTVKSLARMTVASAPGTGTITLGAALNGVTFAQAGVPDGAQVSYGINDGASREVGRGRYTASGTTLSRDVIYESTNGGAAINASAGAIVFVTGLAEDFVESTLLAHASFGGIH